MKQEGLAYFTDTWLTSIGLVIFFSFFVYMLIKVYRVEKKYFTEMSKMPLEETTYE